MSLQGAVLGIMKKVRGYSREWEKIMYFSLSRLWRVPLALLLSFALVLYVPLLSFGDTVEPSSSDAISLGKTDNSPNEIGPNSQGESLDSDIESDGQSMEVRGAVSQQTEFAPQESIAAPSSDDEWAVSISPERNTTNVKIQIPQVESILAQGLADSIQLDATMSYDGLVTRSLNIECPLTEFVDGAHDFDFEDFGKFSVEVSFLKESKVAYSAGIHTVGVTADVYNIAPMCGTLPVTFFSLNLWGDTSIRTSGPVILLLERANSYDWSNLPSAEDGLYGAYALPYLTRNDIRYQPADGSNTLFQSRIQIVADYVHDLMELDPSSRVNLFCVDYYASMVQPIIYANQIPENQYSITLMSDGSFTYDRFSSIYDSETPSATHQKLVDEWKKAKQSAYDMGKAESSMLDWYSGNQYLWTIVDSEANAQLWVARKNLIQSPGDGNEFGKAVQENSKLVQVAIASLLKTNIQSNERSVAQFKKLYNFNDSYFKSAEENGKKIMLFLGTRVELETGFSDYARFAMSYYGDEYEYYYKGHPSTPTALYPNKQQQLESLHATDVDSSIAAELILFFNPNIYLSGYSSSTYASVPEGMAKGMFQMSKETGLSQPIYSNMDYWATQVTDDTEEAIKSLCEMGHSNYLVEFSDSVAAQKGYDVAIWDATDSVITYYRNEGNGVYLKVSSSQGVAERTSIVSGDYIINSSLAQNSVLDVSGGSDLDCANVQLYSYNGSNAQKWRVTVDGEGLASIQNIGSGKYLDAAGGSCSNGTNVWQYSGNGSLAQKWRILSNDNGTMRIVSALDNSTVVDITSGSSYDGTNVQLWHSNSSNAQAFGFLPLDPKLSAEGQVDLADGYYQISSSVNPSYCLDITDWSSLNGSKLQVWQRTGEQNQLFKITKQEDGFYRIENAWSGKSLDVTDGCLIPGTPIQQWDSIADSAVQEWRIADQTGGMCSFQNVATGLMLDLKWGMAQNGQTVNGCTTNGTNAQNWLLTKVANPEDAFDEWVQSEKETLSDGTYLIQSKAGEGLVLDVAGGTSASGGNVQLYSANMTAAQMWKVSHDEKGYVTITNLNSGKVLDVSGGIQKAGANVQQYDGNQSLAQKWIAVRNINGEIELVSALSQSLCLDVNGGYGSQGTNMQIYTRNGTNAQRFVFYKMVE